MVASVMWAAVSVIDWQPKRVRAGRQADIVSTARRCQKSRQRLRSDFGLRSSAEREAGAEIAIARAALGRCSKTGPRAAPARRRRSAGSQRAYRTIR
jgi:hypothetical protein